MRSRNVTPAFTTACLCSISSKYSSGMSISVNTSTSGRQRIVVPVFFRSAGSIVSSLPFFPTTSPFLKCREYLFPSRQTVTSMYSDAYCVAQEPRPLRPRENS